MEMHVVRRIKAMDQPLYPLDLNLIKKFSTPLKGASITYT
jgi:hypothetical protein